MSGAARWLSKEKALIQLSTRYKTDDQFWFSFFHETGHILLHSKKEVFIDEEGLKDEAHETEANEFARRILLPDSLIKEFYNTYDYSGGRKRYTVPNILEFSETKGIAPGILVGYFQRLKPQLHKNKINKLKGKIG